MDITLSIIVAVARGGAIGASGDLLYHISADLRRFKQLTMGHPVIMGRKTFESFPKGPLPGRRNIVVTRNQEYPAEGIERVSSLEEACRRAGEDAFVIGGGEIYRMAMDVADRIYMTEIDADAPGADTFFPAVDPGVWRIVEEGEWAEDPKRGALRYTCLYRR